MRKQLIYLDQSYLSGMTKEAAGLTRPEHASLGQAMGGLLHVLRVLVSQNKVLCPESTVHQQEIGFDDRLEDATYRLLKELSDGVPFLTYRDIEFGQSVRALHRYLGVECDPEDGRWQHAFYRNPHKPIEYPRVYIRIPLPPEFAAEDRRRKALIQDTRLKALADQARKRPASFADGRKEEMLNAARTVYVQDWEKYLTWLFASLMGTASPPATTGSLVQDYINEAEESHPPFAYRLAWEYCRLIGQTEVIPRPDERYWNFFLSPEFDSIPYYDIYCSMDAGLAYYNPDRKPKPSDPYDLAALASAMPYVDIVTTDGAMKNMLLQLGLHEKYRVEVYSSRQTDVEALTTRLARLIGGRAT